MFKKIFAVAAIAAVVLGSASSAEARGGGGGGGHSFSSGGSFSSGSSYSSSTTSTPKFSSGSSYSSPAASAASTPKFSSGASFNTSKPAQTTVVQRPVYSGGYGGTVNNHYYGGNGGFGSSPWFWMWMMDRNQPAYVNGGGYGGGYVNGGPAVVTGGYAPNPVSMVIAIVFQLILLGLFIWFVVWLVRKLAFNK